MPVVRPPSQRVSRLVVTGALGALGLYVLWDFLPALVWATVFAVATWPLYRRFARATHRTPEGGVLAPLGFTVLIGALFLVPLAIIAIELGREALFFARWVPTLEQTGLPVPEWMDAVPFVGHMAAQWWQDNLADPGAATLLLGRLDRSVVIEWMRTLGTQLVRRSTVLVFMLLTLFFLYRDGVALVRDFEALMLRAVGPTGRRVAVQMVLAVRGTVNGLVLVGIAEGVILGIAYVWLGLPHPLLFGGLTGVLAMIPFGALVVYVGAALMLLPLAGATAAIILLGIGSVVVFVADHFVRPALIGGAVKLSFLWVLLGILGGLESFGLLGLFLGPAIMAALVALWHEWIAASAEPSVED